MAKKCAIITKMSNVCVGGEENNLIGIYRLARWLAPKAAILKTEEALGSREHVVCRHLEFEGIVVNTCSTCRETVKNCVH